MKLYLPILVAALTLTAPLTAQFDTQENPEKKIAELADQIANELQEIDRLLLQTGDEGGAANAAEAMARNVKRIDELLKQTTKSQQTAVQRIDELIVELEKLGGG